MSLESNKIFAAVLVAGIIASSSGFIAQLVISPKKLTENAYHIDVPEGGAATADTGPKVAEPIADLLAAADAAHGEKVSRLCTACHTFGKGEANKVGPNLHGVMTHNRAGIPGFAYSEALKSKGGKWDTASMNEFLWSPRAYAPGTKMSFVGLKKPEDRAALIKWMSTQK